MGNVIGLTPSRSGIAIGRLLNAQQRHMPGSEQPGLTAVRDLVT